MSGVFITRGMTMSIPSFSIRLRDDGELDSDPLVLHVRFDVCPTWIQIAKHHLDTALAARAIREQVWSGTDEDAKARALEAEFEASMQAIMATAISLDAAYAVLQQHVAIPPAMIEKWRKGRTARYTQVSEVVRRAFSLKPKGAAALRGNLKEIYRYRDMAVHPSGKIEAALLHPEIDVGVEWRFVYFRAKNAELVVLTAAAMLWDLAYNGKANDPEVTEYQKTLANRLVEVFPSGRPTPPATDAD